MNRCNEMQRPIPPYADTPYTLRPLYHQHVQHLQYTNYFYAKYVSVYTQLIVGHSGLPHVPNGRDGGVHPRPFANEPPNRPPSAQNQPPISSSIHAHYHPSQTCRDGRCPGGRGPYQSRRANPTLPGLCQAGGGVALAASNRINIRDSVSSAINHIKYLCFAK